MMEPTAHCGKPQPHRQFHRMDRREQIAKHISREMRGIEIAPWHSPIVPKREGYNCVTLDFFDTATLHQRAKDDPQVNDTLLERIEDVDIVGSAVDIKSLVEARGELGAFDYIISSHNFEHLPNPVKFLQGCSEVLKPDGMLSMAVPDKRGCFDYFKPYSTTADFVEAYLIKAQALINRYGLPEPSLDEATKEQYKQLYRSAAEPLARYVELTRNQESAEIWGNQAQLLSSVPPSGKSEVFVGREVTTKARLISKPEPTYTEAARQYQVEGTVVLKAVLSSSGKVTNIRIYQTLPSGLTEQAVKAARRIQFVPAVIDGKNVSMWIQLEYNFNLY